MVNATLHEPQYPSCKLVNLETMVNIQDFLNSTISSSLNRRNGNPTSIPARPKEVRLLQRNRKGTKRAPRAILNVTQARNAGLPTGREPYGNGAAVVVRGGESPLQGEGRQVNRMEACKGTCDA